MNTSCALCQIPSTNQIIFTVGAVIIVLGVLYFLVRYVYNHSYVTPANALQMFDSYGEGSR